MFQKFYVNTIQSNFIKYLLLNTNIPMIPFIKNINHVTKNQIYIHDGYIVRAKVSDNVNEILHNIRLNPITYVNYFLKYEPYIFGREYKGLTTRYISNTAMYDPETHYYLGQYLRAYKAYYNIDLMPFYNCFSDEYISNITLERTSSAKSGAPFITYKNKSDSKYKILSVPISFCKEYTIAMDCDSEVLCVPVFVGKKGILNDLTNKMWSTLNVSTHRELHLKSNYIFNRLSFNKPQYFFSPCIPGVEDRDQLSLPSYEKYLRLLIRVPQNNNSSITILEGHYKNVLPYCDKVINLNSSSITSLINEIEITEPIEYKKSALISLTFNNIESIICPNIKESFISCIALNGTDLADNNPFITFDENGSMYITPITINMNTEGDDVPVTFKATIFKESDTIVKDNITTTSTFNLIDYYRNELIIILNNQSNDNSEILNFITLNNKVLTEYQSYQSISIFEDSTLNFDFTDLEYDSEYNSKIIPILSGTHNKCLSLKLEWKQDPENSESYKLCAQLIMHQDVIDTLELDTSNFTTNIISELVGESLNYLVLSFAPTVNTSNISIKANGPIQYWSATYKVSTSDVFTKYLNDNLITNLSLLRLNDHNSYAFCGRLYEYLTNQVISSTDKFELNIKTIQKKLHKPETGIWTEDLRLNIYQTVQDYLNVYELNNIDDMNGFVDKDSENIILSLK